MKKLLLLLLFLSPAIGVCAGFTVTWNPPATGPAPDGYALYIGTTAGSYTTITIDVGKPVNNSYAVTGLAVATKYYAAMKSYR